MVSSMMQGAFCLADREGLDAQDRQAAAFGAWLARARGAQGLTQEQAASDAGVSRVQWARWESGAGLPKRSNLPAIARAVQVSNEDEVYQRAGFIPPSGEWAGASAAPPTETRPRLDEDFSDDDPLRLAYEALYQGLEADLRPDLLGLVAKYVREHQRQSVDFGRKADDDA